MAEYSGSVLTPYNLQLDIEIIGTVQRTMTSPASTGTFLKCAKPTTFPSVAYSANMFIEIYTPATNISEEGLVFKEWGEPYLIFTLGGNRFHQGQIQNQSLTQPATFEWFDGDVYYKNRSFYLNVNDSFITVVFMMDKNYSDVFPSAVNSNGRGWLIDQYSKTVTNQVEIRWGGDYQQDTDLNRLNIFRPENIDVLDLSKGGVQRFLAEERLLYGYQERGVFSLGIYSKYITNNSGQQELIATDEVITKNNVYYLQGNYGVGNQPCAVFRGEDEVHYFSDPVRGDQLRRSGDGITPISQLYYGQYTIRDLLAKYNNEYLRPDGSIAKIMGFYDYFEGQANFILQGGTFQSSTIDSYNFSFSERRKGYCGFYQWFPDWALQGEKTTYAWKNGQLYVFNDEVNRCKFFGTQFYPSITLVFNDKTSVNKIMKSIGYQSEGKVWACSKLSNFNGGENLDAIVTSSVNQQTGFRQSSRLKEYNFSFENEKTVAALLNDINSNKNGMLGLYEGDYLTGFWIEIEFKYSGTDFVTMDAPFLNWEVSNRNF